jgi:hypothetical protein
MPPSRSKLSRLGTAAIRLGFLRTHYFAQARCDLAVPIPLVNFIAKAIPCNVVWVLGYDCATSVWRTTAPPNTIGLLPRPT